VWNFFETRIDKEAKIKLEDRFMKPEGDQEEEVKEEKPYLINHNANPIDCYKFEERIHENRVKKFIKLLETLTQNLKTHEEVNWKMLTTLCIEIKR
jgi:hypothetical protein